MNKVLNDLYDYDNLKIYQYDNSFKFSIDSILLSEYVKLNSKTKNILDLCTGNAVIPLILSTKTKAQIDAFEIQKNIFELGYESIKFNKKEEQINIFNADIKELNKYVNNKKYDIITCNPPYFKVANPEYINASECLAISRHEIKITLNDIFSIAATHLNSKGEFYLVHRANRLDEIILLASSNNLNVKNITFIETKANTSPYIILVRCIKNSSYGIKISKVINIDGKKTYQNMFKEVK